MELNSIQNIPVFLKLANFSKEKRDKDGRFYLKSKLYNTDKYPKVRYNKPIVF